MTLLGPSLRFMITEDDHYILIFGDNGEFPGGVWLRFGVAFGAEEI